MLNVRNVLVPSDYSEVSRRAFEHARFAAKRFGATLHVLHIVEAVRAGALDEVLAPKAVFHDRSVTELVDYAGEGMDDAAMRAEKAARDRSTFDVTSKSDEDIRFVRRTAKSPSEGILNCAAEIDADLIVMGTRGRRGPHRLFMGSLAEDVVHGADCPVLTIRSGGLTVPGRGVSRILVPVDFSDVSESQVLHAQELADAYGAELDILHVVETPHEFSFYSMDEFNASLPSVAAKARAALADLAARGRASVPTRVHVLVGHPAIDILDFAEAQGSDLILVATHAHKGARHMLLGSVAEQVIRRAPLLVVTMKASGKSLLSAESAGKSLLSTEAGAKPQNAEASPKTPVEAAAKSTKPSAIPTS